MVKKEKDRVEELHTFNYNFAVVDIRTSKRNPLSKYKLVAFVSTREAANDIGCEYVRTRNEYGEDCTIFDLQIIDLKNKDLIQRSIEFIDSVSNTMRLLKREVYDKEEVVEKLLQNTDLKQEDIDDFNSRYEDVCVLRELWNRF